MAATVSPWAKPGAWALDSEEHEDELLQQQQRRAQEDDSYNRREPEQLADFPSLSTAAAAATKSKKKKGQTLSLAEFSTYSAAKQAQSSLAKGLTHEDLMRLPTGPRERTDEELDRSRLGGGFRSYGSNGSFDRNRYSNGDDSSNSRWGSSRVSDETRRPGGFGRDSSRESAPSRADEIDDWAAAKKSPVGNGFERKERGGGGGGFFDSQSKADESDNWASNKTFVPSEGRRFGAGGGGGGFDRERRGGFDSFTNGSGADSESWGKKKEEGSGTGTGTDTGTGTGSGRPRLNLQPRTLPSSNGQQQGSGTIAKPKGSNPFGEARPREEVLAEKGQDWKKIDEQLDSMKIKEIGPAGATDAPSFGKRSFGSGNGRASLPESRTERTWRKPDSVDVRPPSAEKSEDGLTEEN